MALTVSLLVYMITRQGAERGGQTDRIISSPSGSTFRDPLILHSIVMEIVWHGHSFFRVRAREATIVIDPHARHRGARITADIGLISHDHPGHNAREVIGGTPRILSGPGEYDVTNVAIVGVQTAHDVEQGRRRGRNTVWLVTAEEMRVCHLGDLGHQLSSSDLDAIGAVDILMTPVGGHNALDGRGAAEVVRALEPRVVIPMHFAEANGDLFLGPVEPFLREQGVIGATRQARVNVTRSSLPPAGETQVVVLEPRKPEAGPITPERDRPAGAASVRPLGASRSRQ